MMKKICSMLILAIPLMGICQQQKFTIKGKIEGLSAKTKAYLVYQIGAELIQDSCKVINGTFLFTGTVPEAFEASLSLGHAGRMLDNNPMDSQRKKYRNEQSAWQGVSANLDK